MQNKHQVVSHIYSVLPLDKQILVAPRRSYSELQQALKRAENLAERVLTELLVLKQNQQFSHHVDTPDKQQVIQQMQFIIKQAQRHSSGFAIMHLQLDHFKHIQDSCGAPVAKQISELTLHHLRTFVRDCDLVGQQSEDQFLLLITDVSRIYDAALVAEKLLQRLTLLNELCIQPIVIACSIGISRFPEDGNDAFLLIEKATAALQHAQRRGGAQFSLLR
ncbi:GGDEF domain-containing protein [Rheinheimera metallidurans]|uniref:GGDEF domain-containing protein n=1 Tax=Rheinheimera metallidurans TaxID=2925781 RepID=UPI003001B29E